MGLSVTIRALQKPDWDWVQTRVGCILCEDTDGVMALRGRDLVAASIFDQFSETSCFCHLVMEDPFVIRSDFLFYSFAYPFWARNKELLVGCTPADNKEALRLNKKMGFREVYRIPEAYKKGVDLVIQEMRRDECRWLDRRTKRAA